MKSRMRRPLVAVMLVGSLCLSNALAQSADALTSWNKGAIKARILAFVGAVSEPGGREFVAPADRVAVFDNDGTLWAEQPVYFQAFFIMDRIKALGPKHPQWKTREPFASLLKGAMKAVMAGGEKTPMPLATATHAGMSTDEFKPIVSDWIATARHPRTGRLLTELTDHPMKELLAHLRTNGFKTCTSCRAVASSSCGPGPSGSTAFRPSRGSAAASRRSSIGATVSPRRCANPT
jgi:hypothetical protein